MFQPVFLDIGIILRDRLIRMKHVIPMRAQLLITPFKGVGAKRKFVVVIITVKADLCRELTYIRDIGNGERVIRILFIREYAGLRRDILPGARCLQAADSVQAVQSTPGRLL